MSVHVCYAFRFGSDKKLFRSIDDGEPSNSAGPPILGQIQSYDLTNVLLAVVRYYGGTNLGVGGLINAYRTAAKEAIENTEIINDEERIKIQVSFTYEDLPKVIKLIKNHNCIISEQLIDQNCVFKINTPVSNKLLLNQLKEIQGLELKEI
ncbi:MAG: IMPACT family protein [Bacteroidota bacterium]